MSAALRLRRLFGSLLPPFVDDWRRAVAATRPLHPRSCSICGYHGHFSHFGRPPRVDALCPGCHSVERHRFQWLYLRDARLEGSILHFAAEACLEQRLRAAYGARYRTADLFTRADLRLNLERLELPDASVGGIICNHVLEHVDDSRALPELRRVLQPRGKLVCSVPLVYGWSRTYEDPAITDGHERELHYGQDDHVRYYGRDFVSRLREAGFDVEERTAEGPDCVTYSLLRGDKFFICTRRDPHEVPQPS
jgi:SAM-dependent methyltransferase